MTDALQRFVEAQQHTYDLALREIRHGRKHSHWMWFIFPQLQGLGRSTMAEHYGIKDLKEASRYIDHDVLGPRLIQISKALLETNHLSASEIFGSPDDMKLHSCMTLFAAVPNSDIVFQRLLDKYFNGIPDQRTFALLRGDDYR
ncbi:MAG TPA: DUF1810 domain-containing protein [Flavobacterium sp.]|nr:DUF1810 domain-containing protein [Flavobacterium sp.]